MDTELIEKITKQFNEAGVTDVSIKLKKFLNKPWLYFLIYHKGKGLIYDMSVATYNHYGICIGVVKDEWRKQWKEEW